MKAYSNVLSWQGYSFIALEQFFITQTASKSMSALKQSKPSTYFIMASIFGNEISEA
jgi:hypothetical protein